MSVVSQPIHECVGHDTDVDRLVMTFADLQAKEREDLLNYARFLKEVVGGGNRK